MLDEKLALDRLSALSDDDDRNLQISEKDLRHPQAGKILKKMELDDYVKGDLSQNARILTGYYVRIRLASALFMENVEVLPDSTLRFYDGDNYERSVHYRGEMDSCSFDTLSKADENIVALLKKVIPDQKPASEIYFSPLPVDPRPAIHGGNRVKMSQAVYDELKRAYDCKTEQKYLLLANRRTGVIEKALRPMQHESAHSCDFEQGWQDYIASILKITSSQYVIVGDYHSHPGLISEGFAGYNSSPDDIGSNDPGVYLIGHAEAKDKNSPDFAKTFQINGYGAKYKKFKVKIVPAKNGEGIFLDDLVNQNDPFVRGSKEIEVESKKAAIKITLYYDDSYTIDIVLKTEPFTGIQLQHQKNYYHNVQDKLTGMLKVVAVAGEESELIQGGQLAEFMRGIYLLLNGDEKGASDNMHVCPVSRPGFDAFRVDDHVRLVMDEEAIEGKVDELCSEAGIIVVKTGRRIYSVKLDENGYYIGSPENKMYIQIEFLH